jgi:hypothetical protein
MKTFVANLDDGLYLESYKVCNSEYGSEPLQYLAMKAYEAGIAPSDKELATREQHYLRKFNIDDSQPSRVRKAKQYAHDLYALEKVFEHFGVPIDDPESTVDKAFTISTLRAVFPEFYDSLIVAGILAMPLLDVLVSHSETSNRTVFDHITLNETAADRSTSLAGEFTTFSETNITLANAPVKVKKFGQALKSSDEAMQNASLPVFQRTLERIGMQLMIDITDFALDVLLLGDGNSGAASATAAAVSGAPTFADWTSLIYAFAIGYQPSDFIATSNALTKLVTTIPEFKDPFAWSRPFQVSGVPPSVFGLNPHRWDSQGSSNWATTKVLVIQRDRCLAQYNNGGLKSEQDRIINGQWALVTTSLSTAFAIWDPASRRLGTGFG